LSHNLIYANVITSRELIVHPLCVCTCTSNRKGHVILLSIFSHLCKYRRLYECALAKHEIARNKALLRPIVKWCWWELCWHENVAAWGEQRGWQDNVRLLCVFLLLRRVGQLIRTHALILQPTACISYGQLTNHSHNVRINHVISDQARTQGGMQGMHPLH